MVPRVHVPYNSEGYLKPRVYHNVVLAENQKDLPSARVTDQPWIRRSHQQV